jgi:hypothetical protein
MLEETSEDADNDPNGRPIHNKNTRIYNITLDTIARWAGMSILETKQELSNFVKNGDIVLHNDKIQVKDITRFERLVTAERSRALLLHKI